MLRRMLGVVRNTNYLITCLTFNKHPSQRLASKLTRSGASWDISQIVRTLFFKKDDCIDLGQDSDLHSHLY